MRRVPWDGDRAHHVIDYERAADAWQWTMDEHNQGKVQPFSMVTFTKKRREEK
jgi:hypothetical protein